MVPLVCWLLTKHGICKCFISCPMRVTNRPYGISTKLSGGPIVYHSRLMRVTNVVIWRCLDPLFPRLWLFQEHLQVLELLDQVKEVVLYQCLLHPGRLTVQGGYLLRQLTGVHLDWWWKDGMDKIVIWTYGKWQLLPAGSVVQFPVSHVHIRLTSFVTAVYKWSSRLYTVNTVRDIVQLIHCSLTGTHYVYKGGSKFLALLVHVLAKMFGPATDWRITLCIKMLQLRPESTKYIGYIDKDYHRVVTIQWYDIASGWFQDKRGDSPVAVFSIPSRICRRFWRSCNSIIFTLEKEKTSTNQLGEMGRSDEPRGAFIV